MKKLTEYTIKRAGSKDGLRFTLANEGCYAAELSGFDLIGWAMPSRVVGNYSMELWCGVLGPRELLPLVRGLGKNAGSKET
jgi:hypothetical protein